MSKKKKWILFASIMVVACLTLWLSYDFHFKYVINKYQERRIEKNLERNFIEHRQDFDDILSFSNQIKRLENLEFKENDAISFHLKDSLLVDSLLSDTSIIQIGNDSFSSIDSLRFSDTNSVWISSEGQEKVYRNWMIWYDGKMSDPMLSRLLSYNNITTQQLLQLKDKLDKIKCEAYSKTDSSITIRFVGHSFECFNYVIPLKNTKIQPDWINLADNYYWEHYRSGIFCGWSDWSWNE